MLRAIADPSPAQVLASSASTLAFYGASRKPRGSLLSSILPEDRMSNPKSNSQRLFHRLRRSDFLSKSFCHMNMTNPDDVCL